MNATTDITVIVRGGVVQGTLGIPEGVRLIVRDYDVQADENDCQYIFTDKDGEKYHRCIWEGGDV